MLGGFNSVGLAGGEVVFINAEFLVTSFENSLLSFYYPSQSYFSPSFAS